MKKEEFSFRSTSDVCNIRGVRYIPDGEIKAILQISHGMQEFIDRYEDFAKYLCDKGYLVVGNDHLGHGGSINTKDDWGYFAEKDGNRALLDDLYEVTKITKENYPNLPYILLGHSMGSFYARQYICEHGNELVAAIIMGTGHQPLPVVKAGMQACKIFALGKGWRYRSKAVEAMAFGAYNKKFEPARTDKEWLTKDASIIDWYINEPRCSYKFTLNGYYNMFKGISRLHDKNLLNQIPKKLPILFVSGQDDPVGDFGKGVEAAFNSVKNVGCENVEIKLYPNDRHEILNELDKKQVYEDLYNWMQDKFKCR